MKKLMKFSAFALGAALMTATPALADGHMDGAIKARKAVMQLYAYSLGTLGAMAKGQVEYNAEAAQAAADNLVKAASINQSSMWPQGSDSTAMPDKTRAKSEIWSTYPEVANKGKALVDAANAMADAAGKDLASLQGAMGAVGGSCGGCHKPFRVEQN